MYGFFPPEIENWTESQVLIFEVELLVTVMAGVGVDIHDAFAPDFSPATE
jgi:hypothetical protein